MTVGGVLRIVTESGSEYLIDLDRSMLRRLARVEEVWQHGTTDLRRDGEWLSIMHMAPLRVGQPAVFDLEPLGDPALTFMTTRVTTPVVSIEPFDDRG